MSRRGMQTALAMRGEPEVAEAMATADAHVGGLWRMVRDMLERSIPLARPGWMFVVVERGAGDSAVVRRVMGPAAYDEATAVDAAVMIGLAPLADADDLVAYAPLEVRTITPAGLRACEGIPVLVLHRHGISCLSGLAKGTARVSPGGLS